MKALLAVLTAAALALVAAPALAQPTSGSSRFSVEVSGQGPDVILIPGLTSSSDVFAATADRLDDTHRVHRVQVAGFAGAPPAGDSAGPVVAPLAEDLAAYIAREGLRRPAVIGHSLGGEAALMLAARHPEAVGRVMVVDALPFFSLLFSPNATPETSRPFADQMRDAMLGQTPEQFEASQRGTMMRMVRDPVIQSRYVGYSLASDRRTVANAMHEIMVTDLRPELPRITVPTTVLYAFNPAMGMPAERVDALYASAYVGLRGGRLVRVDDSFHFIMDDQPERFAQEVEAFLR